ncbi:MAG TPA: alpha/beta fold hydrolase [Polyangiaceae bacterium]|nr:alpha/beta fold hydrolase [Polyangiaceae bacterium]
MIVRTVAILWALAGAALGGCGGEDARGGQAPAPQPSAQAGAAVRDTSFLKQYAVTRAFGQGEPTGFRVAPGGERVFFVRSDPREGVRDLYAYDVKAGAEKVVLSSRALLGQGDEVLSPEERARRERMRLTAKGIAQYELSLDGSKLLAPLGGRLFLHEVGPGTTRELEVGKPAPVDPRFSPDGAKVSFVRAGDLYVIDLATGRETRLTEGATETVTHGLAEFVAQEEMARFVGYWWSPDAKFVAYQRTDNGPVERFYIADPAHPERAPQSFPYPRAGKANAEVTLGVAPAAGGPTVWVTWDRKAYPYLATARWDRGGPLVILVQNRAQTEEVLLSVDPATGATKPLLVERDPVWVNLDQSVPRWLRDGSGFLWSTERGGAFQLELRGPDGALVRALSAPGLGYRKLVGVDEARKVAYVIAGDEPSEAHLFALPLGGGEPKRLDPPRGPAEVSAFVASDGSALVLASESAEAPPRFSVLRPDGSEAGEIRNLAEKPSVEPKVTFTQVDPVHHFRAAIVKPRDFQPGRRYPVLVNAYGGPHARMVYASRKRYLIPQWVADQGFVVVMFDGRGTPYRGREWERAIKGKAGEVPLEDQVRALRELAQQTPELDLSRVGIYGWSYGGYMASYALLKRPDVFHAAVAGAPVTDWHDYDTHYTERYLGLPDEANDAYDRTSVLLAAKELRRPLLIIHGTADDNVYFFHGVKLSDALLRAGKPHEFLPLAGATHMVTDPAVVEQQYVRIAEFFRQHLGEKGR